MTSKCSLLFTIAVLSASFGLQAQEQQSSPSADSQVAEVVVTATRREEPLQSVPITVNVVSGAAMSNARIDVTSDLPQLVPNLTISSQVGAWIVYIRGVGQLATNAGQEPSVATYVDGVYQPNVFSSLLSLPDVQRVEVVKGPQGTLFGRNATGGLINVVMRDPSHDSSAEALVSYGNYDTYRASVYGTTGLGDKAAIDISAYLYDQDHGVGSNVTTGDRLGGTRNVDLRTKFLLEPWDATKIRISASYTQNVTSVGNGLAILPGSVAVGGYTALPGFYDVQNNVDPLARNDTYQISGRLDQQLPGPFDIVNIVSYTHTQDREFEDADGTPLPLIYAVLTQFSNTFTEELQAVTKKGSPVNGILGLYYFHSNAAGEPTGTGLYGVAFGGGGEQSRPQLKTDSVAVYGEGTYEFLPHADITLGARYTRDKKDLAGGIDTIAPGGATSTTAIGPYSDTWSQTTPRAMLDYHLTPAVMVYGQYSRGFKSGGYDTGFPTGIPYAPETVDDFEGGFKTEFFNHRLRFNIAGFHYNYKNLQLPVLVPGPGGSVSQITVNATNAHVNGTDIDGLAQLTDNFSVNFGFGYLDSKYSNFPNAPCTQRNAEGATVQVECDVSGLTTSHAPKETFNFGGTYTLPTSVGKFALSANYSMMTKFYYDVADRLSQGGYGLINAQLAWTLPSDRFTVAVYGENLANKEYTVAQYAQAGLGDTYVAGTPRMYGIELRARF